MAAWTLLPLSIGEFFGGDMNMLNEVFLNQQDINTAFEGGLAVNPINWADPMTRGIISSVIVIRPEPHDDIIYGIGALRYNFELMLEKYYFLADNEINFVRLTVAEILSRVYGVVKTGWALPGRLDIWSAMNELYRLTNYMAKNVYSQWSYGVISLDEYRWSSFEKVLPTVGEPGSWWPDTDWESVRNLGREDLITYDLSSYVDGSYDSQRPSISFRMLNNISPDSYYYNDGEEDWGIGVAFNYGLRIQTQDWNLSLQNFSKAYLSGELSGQEQGVPGESSSVKAIGIIRCPITVGGTQVEALNDENKHSPQDHIANLTSGTWDFNNPTDIILMPTFEDLQDQIFTPPDHKDAVTEEWDVNIFYDKDSSGGVIVDGGIIAYDCVKSHISGAYPQWTTGTYPTGTRRRYANKAWIVTAVPDTSFTPGIPISGWTEDNDKPGVGNAWETYWEVNDYGWSAPEVFPTYSYESEYRYMIPDLLRIYVQPTFTWAV
jgi:hypothetical protein